MIHICSWIKSKCLNMRTRKALNDWLLSYSASSSCVTGPFLAPLWLYSKLCSPFPPQDLYYVFISAHYILPWTPRSLPVTGVSIPTFFQIMSSWHSSLSESFPIVPCSASCLLRNPWFFSPRIVCGHCSLFPVFLSETSWGVGMLTHQLLAQHLAHGWQ